MKGKSLKIGAVVVMLLLLVEGVFAGNVMAKPAGENNEKGKDKVLANVNEYMASMKGKIIAEGIKLPNGDCKVNYNVIGWGNSNNNFGKFNISLTEDCKVVIDDAVLEYSSNPEIPSIDPTGSYERYNKGTNKNSGAISSVLSSGDVSLLSGVEREGWAYQEYEEQFHVDVTKAWVEMDYWDDGNSVYNGHDQWLNLWWRTGTGWYKIDHGLWYSLSGPSSVWIEGYGEYDNNYFDLWHRLWVEFEGYH